MAVQDYPITELYGCQPGYPLNQNLCPPGQGFHNGIDYGCPVGTPVVVNGVTIGISGATGAVTGPHCHVGKWLNGKSVDPGVGNGFHFSSAVVSEINQDPTNGKYVRVQGDGYSWVYLHMSDNSKVSVGQVLQQGDEMITKDILDSVYGAYYGSTPTQADYDNWVGKNELSNLIYQAERDPRRKAYFDSVQKGFACLQSGGGTTLKPGKYIVN